MTQASESIDFLRLNLGVLKQIAPPESTSTQFDQLKSALHNSRSNAEYLIPSARDYYKSLVDEFVKIRQAPAKLKGANDRAIAFLERAQTQGRIISFLNCDRKPAKFGMHRLQVELAEQFDEEAKQLTDECAKKCQELMLAKRRDFAASIQEFNIKEECIKFAEKTLITLCGGEGKDNLLDRLQKITYSSVTTRRESIAIPLSSAIATAAFLVSEQITTRQDSEDGINRVAAERLRVEQVTARSAAESAAAARPSSETEESIRTTLTREIAAQTREIVRQEIARLNLSAAKSQSPQRTVAATIQKQKQKQTGGKGRGRGGHNAATTTTQGNAQGRERGRLRSTSPAQGTRPPRSTSRNQARSPSTSPPPPPPPPRNIQFSPRHSNSGASSSPAPSLPPRRSARDFNRGREERRGNSAASTTNQSEAPNAERGSGRGRGRGRGRGQASRSQ